MTTTLMTPATVTVTVDRFLEAVTAGRGADVGALFAAHGVLDATVPMWRFTLTGPDAVAAQYARWFTDPGTFEELERLPVPGGEVVRYVLRSRRDGVPYTAHQSHVFDVGDDGLIVHDQFFCGGRWDDDLVARMAEEQRGG